MASFKDVASAALELLDYSLPFISPGIRGEVSRSILQMKESFTEADAEPAGKVFRHGGAAAYWKHYRETQEFEFELRGEGSELVIGVEAAASRARLKPNTFKQRMAQGHGVLNMVLQEDGREKCVTITRLGR